MKKEFNEKAFNEICEFFDVVIVKYNLDVVEFNSMLLSVVLEQYKHGKCPVNVLDEIAENMKRVYRQKEG